MKNYLLAFFCFTLTGCPVYDPPVGLLKIRNNSNRPIYVHLSCSENLLCDNPIKIEDLHFRVNFRSNGGIAISGTPENPKLPCDSKVLTLFIIKEQILKSNAWEKICKEGLFERKIELKESELKSSDWQIIYNPN